MQGNACARRAERSGAVCAAACRMLSGASVLLASVGQAADSYPNRPVRMLIPYAAGGATDTIARDIAPKLQQVLGQPFVVPSGCLEQVRAETKARAEVVRDNKVKIE